MNAYYYIVTLWTKGGRLLAAAAGLLLLAGAGVRAGVPAAHRGLTNYVDARTCTACHTNAAAEVMHTTHWTWEHTEAATGRRLGKRTVINNYCVALPSNEPRCTSCHAGVGYRDKNFDFTDATKVDCLVCHDTTGTYKKFPTLAGAPWTGPGPTNFNGVTWQPVNQTYVAQNAGKSSRATCGACHFFGGGGDAVKHGDLDSSLFNPTRTLDVHMGTNGLNFRCATCHETKTHDIPGSIYSKDHTDNQTCEKCHTARPHKTGTTAGRLNAHTGRVACQTCHVPEYARGRTTMTSWDWSTAGVKGTNGQNIVIKDANGDPIYDTQKGTFTWDKNVRPRYVWFNGQLDYLTVEDVIDPTRRVAINRLHGDITDAKARIMPVKRFTGRQPYDPVNNVLAVPHLFGGDTNAYWKTFNWTNALAAGMAYVGRPFSGQVGWVETEMFWIENHMVAPKEKALACTACHTPQDGRLDFAALGYEAERAARLTNFALLNGPDHAGRFGTNFLGSASCVQCHPGKVDEVMDTVHYTWRTPNPKLAYPGGGSHGMIDRFCALVGASAMVNYYADLGDHKGSSACGKCHIGQELPFPDPSTGQYTQTQKDHLDCLICHASAGNYDMTADAAYDEHDAEASHRALKTDPQSGRRYWFQDKSLRAAESVGRRVDTDSCLRCHEHGQAAPDYKRGTPYKPQHDVHAAAGVLCTACHKVEHHKMARGSRVTDMHGWELQNVEVDCANCHGNRPHPEYPWKRTWAPYNEHVAFMACETCHIPRTSGASRRVWYSTFGMTNGPEASIPKPDPNSGVFEPYSVYEASYGSRPAYRWFNGDASMLAEPVHDANAWDFRVATRDTPRAKIYPLRPIISGMIMDRRGFGYDPNFNPQFTMLAAMDMMEAPMKMMGFMRPEGLNPRERAVLSQFPNLVNFDKEHYVHTGNVREAVNIGLGRLGLMMMGQDAWAVPPSALNDIGSNFWSGDLLGLDLPNNPTDPTFDPNNDPTHVTGSFISLSHGIKRNEALRCLDCHSRASVLDFRALSYSPARATQLQTLFEKVQFITLRHGPDGLLLRWSAKPSRAYQLMSTTDLKSGVWTPVGERLSGVEHFYEHVVPPADLATGRQLFYRVVELPQ
ncbi:MAG: tetrathionate reductase family octaheme c-type cytochrome [Verrucomicrobia bacterium]|nr:tetrathionate reductase family octaheme c-type cytochrome [Verrucomicrobiota bacterium]